MTTTQLKFDISESDDGEDHIDDLDDSYFKLQKINRLKRFKEKYPNGIGEITEFNFLNTSTNNSNQ